VNADGSGAMPLTQSTTVSSFDAAWSPNGARVAYTHGNNPTFNLRLMNADGTSDRAVTSYTFSGVDARDPSWSPDGNRLVFTNNGDFTGLDAPNANSRRNLWLADVSGVSFTVMPLTDSTLTAQSWDFPKWSSTNRIAFFGYGIVDGSAPGGELHVMNPDGSGLAPLVVPETTANANWTFQYGAWTQDGSQFVFSYNGAFDKSPAALTNYTYNLWAVNSDGSGLNPVTRMTAGGNDCYVGNWNR
jgi:Tol biopolymer transport system component